MKLIKTIAWWLFFTGIMVINIPLVILGALLVCPLLIVSGKRNFPIWGNTDDGFGPKEGFWNQYYWLAIRNPTANLRRIPYVSGKDRPILYHWWTSTPAFLKSGHYIKIGWESGPPHYPVFQPFGAGRGY